MSCHCKLTGRLSEISHLHGSLSALSNLSGSLTVPVDYTAPTYEGEYEITPAVYEQSFDTAGKKMGHDLVVLEIPYAETSNLSGGYTAIIGG